MGNFIYVFSVDAYKKLIKLQYKVIKSDFEKGVFVFLNEDSQKFSDGDFKFTLSDTLTFNQTRT